MRAGKAGFSLFRVSIGAIAALIALASSCAAPARAEDRVALVIGNSNYAFGRLANPVNDANLMATSLETAGFAVTKLLDADQATMKRAMLEFGRSLRSTDSVGLFYFAGHGVQVEGENYLIPVGANIKDENDVAIESVSANEFLKTMERSASRVNIAIFDACRNNPFASSSRSATRGLAVVDAPRGTIIAYATAPGDVAYDGKDGNSPYTQALSRTIATPGITIEETFKRTRRDVLASTNQRQTPWESSSLTGDFYFKPSPEAGSASVGAETVVAPPPDEKLVELKAYEDVKSSNDKAALEAFLARFPEGAFTEVVKLKLARLSAGGLEAGSGTSGAGTTAAGADDGSPDALYRKGLALETGQGGKSDPVAAAALYQQAAAKGHAGAMAALGSLAERGQGLTQSYAEAAHWYRRAADKGDARGLTSLGVLTEEGSGVPKDEVEAARLYRRAAELGSAKALNNLAMLLSEGRGGPRDDNEAFRLFAKAADLDYPNAMHNLATYYEQGRGVQRDKTAAAQWYKRAADKGYAPSETALATLMEFGDGVPKDMSGAVALYRKAADAGDAEGLASLAYLYEQGKGVPQDLAEAAKYYGKAADAGDPRAMHNLATMYHQGRGVKQDYAEAARLYRASADKGYAASLRGLAVLYDEGKGVARDPGAAADNLLKAFQLGHKTTRDELLLHADTWSEETRRQIQLRLRKAGLFKGRADGKFGPPTLAALRKLGKLP